MSSKEIDVVRLDADKYLSEYTISWTNFNARQEFRAVDESGLTVVASNDVKSIWFRKVILGAYDFVGMDINQQFARREIEALLNNMYACLEDRLWINHPKQNRFAENKLHQLQLAAKLGFMTPETLVTSNPDEAESFILNLKPKRVVYKTLSRPLISDVGDEVRSVFTSEISEITTPMRSAIRVAPCLFQEYIEKDYELRITVVGNQVFAARIYSQEHEETKLDWRRDQHKVTLRHEVENLDPQLERMCINLTRSLGLTFGAIDMIVTPRQERVFLEINPNGQWGWIEKLTGLPIADALIDVLTG